MIQPRKPGSLYLCGLRLGHVNPQILGVIRIIAPPPPPRHLGRGEKGNCVKSIAGKKLQKQIKAIHSQNQTINRAGHKTVRKQDSLNLRSILVRIADLKLIFFVDFVIYFINMSLCLSFLRLL